MKAPLSLFVIPSATIMGLRPTQGNEKLFRLVLLLVPNRSVIPTGAKRSGGTCCSSSKVSNLNRSATLPFVIPSEAEGSAVSRTFPGDVFPLTKQKCHPDRSEAEWRDLLFILQSIESESKRYPPLCHPERSRGICGFADLSWRCFSINQTEVSSGAKRSGGTCCSSSKVSNLNGSATLPFVIPTGAYPDFLPHC